MSTQMDCPICMDCIECTTKNFITTECGHSFHANCLMQSISHTGFGCPYCRTSMAEEQDDEDDESIDSYWGDDLYDDDALRGFRFFCNLLNGEEHSQEDIDEEDQYVLDMMEYEENEENENIDEGFPSVQYVADKLKEQGVTFEKIIETLLHLNHEGYRNFDEAQTYDNQIYGKIRTIISRYQPEDSLDVENNDEEIKEQEKVEVRIKIETIAQPKSLEFEQKRRVECC